MPRVYAPVSDDDVAQLLTAAECHPLQVFGLGPRLREALPNADEEELEHLATQLAAASSRHDPVTVAVFDAPEGAVEPREEGDASLGAFRLVRPLRRRDLACFLVADPGERVSDDADLELSWYDAGEISVVQELVTGSHGS